MVVAALDVDGAVAVVVMMMVMASDHVTMVAVVTMMPFDVPATVTTVVATEMLGEGGPWHQDQGSRHQCCKTRFHRSAFRISLELRMGART
ncbi:hypothetical protein [Methylobacterium iners]|uniref:hypothetical protein n=1 Tax=Methylobacterium iners TaxID=418707 RepID=UPI001EE1F6DD|nr:hypothetical protein [Methylobacterium iners]